MDFLLSFRSQKETTKIGSPQTLRNEDLVESSTPFIKFLLLPVDNNVWKFLQIQGICVRYFITTFIIGYCKMEMKFGVSDIINAIIDVFYLVDVIAAFIYRWKWPKSTKHLQESSPYLSRLVWRNQLFRPRRIWMIVVDIISLIPYEVFGSFVYFNSFVNTAAHCAPMLRIYRLPLYYLTEYKKLSLRVHTMFTLFVRIGLSWALLTHSFTCLWGWLSKVDHRFDLHKFTGIELDTSSPFQWYLIIFYFIQIGFTNIGFGDLTPHNVYERALNCFVIMAGFMLLSGYFIAALSSVLMEKIRRLTHLQYRLSRMTFELNSKRVPDWLSKKIIRFYYSLWAARKGIGRLNTFLDTLPPSFSTRVYLDIFTPALNASLLFRACDEYSKRAIASVMKIHLYMAGDAILKRREFNAKMFYIRKGTIQLMSYQDDETEVMTFGAGTVFGQISVILSLPTKSEVHAATFCEIHTISRRHLFAILKNYPAAKKIVMNTHKNMLLNVMADKFQKKKDGEKTENVLTTSSFYKMPIETSKLARDDICIVTTCPYVFMPDTIFLKAWNAFIATIIIVISFYYPYTAAFQRLYPIRMEPFIIAVDVILFFNLYITYSTAFVKENIINSSLRDIIGYKLTTFYAAVDIAAIMPIHYFMHNTNRLKSVLLCVRCLLFYKVHLMFQLAEFTSGRATIIILRLMKYILYFLLGAYAMGLIYYMEACYNFPCIRSSWYDKVSGTMGDIDPIWVSVYFATLVMSGTGFGDVTAGNIRDIVYVSTFAVFGVMLFIYLIADYSANISLSRQPRQKFVELADRVNSFLLSQKMLRSERTRVRQFLNLQWERSEGYEFTSENSLFYDTPPHLLYAAAQFTKSRGISKMKLFEGMDSAVVGSILNSAFRKIFPPHEVVIYAGELCNHLMIIEEGYCEVTYGKDVSITKIIQAGKDICTVELMLNLTALCHVRTLTHCIIMKVSKPSLKRALTLNPISAKELQKSIDAFKSSAILRNVVENRPILLHLTVRTTVEKSFFRFRYNRKQSGNKDLRGPYLRLGLCKWIRFLLRSTTILPYGKYLKRWEFSRCIFAFLSAVLFPCIPYFQLQVPFLYYLGIFLDLSAFIDLYFRAHICYYNEKNILVSHPLWTCGHYIKGSFVLDFIFSIPFDRVMFRPIYDIKGEAFVTTHSVDFLRIFRVGQVYRIPATLSSYGVDFLSTPPLFWVLLSALSLTTVFITLLSSILVLMSVNYKRTRTGSYHIVYNPSVKTHFENLIHNFNFTSKPFDIFLLNFYWTATTAFAVGIGDITADTRELMIYVVVVIALSYLYFNYVTVVIASYLATVNMNLTIFQKRMQHLVSFLNTENVEPLLRKHIVNHFEYIWKKNKGMKAQYVFLNFSSALRDDVMFHLYEETVRGVYAFSNLDASFHRLLSSQLDEIHFQSGAAIYKPGDIISQFFIVHQGEVTIVGKDENETTELNRSKIFGVLKNLPQASMTLSAVATKNVTVLAIDAVELFKILNDIQSGIIEQERVPTAEFEKAMQTSNTTKTELEEEMTVVKSKSRNEFVYVIHKFSKHIMLFYVILSLYSANMTSYNLAFQHSNNVIFYATVMVELLFVVKIFLGFHTGYVDEFGDFVSDLRLIKASYVKTIGFYLDVITTIPFDVLAFFSSQHNRHYISTWLRLGKLLRLYNVWYFFNMRFDTLNVNMVMLKIAALGIWTGTLLHQCTCIWFLVTCPMSNCTGSATWQFLETQGIFYQYLNSFYFVTVILTTTGYGDITPHTKPEIICVISLFFISFFYTAIFIGEMVSTTQKYLYAKTHYEFEVEGLENYLHVNDVPHETRKVIFNYVKNLWRNEKGLQIPELLRNAPRYLTYEIKASTYGHHINEHPVFKACTANFRKQLITLLLRTVFYPGDIVVYKGEVNATAYFVHSGQVECQNESTRKIYTENSYFGLSQCLKKDLQHVTTYYAISSCVILSLNMSSCDYLKSFFPDDLKYLESEFDKIRNQEISFMKGAN